MCCVSYIKKSKNIVMNKNKKSGAALITGAAKRIGREIALRVSAGASVFPEDGETYERLLARADRRMYRNKAESKTTRPLRLRAGLDDVARLRHPVA